MPGQQAILSEDNGFTISEAQLTATEGWTKGELNFVSQSLKEIVKSLERTYNVHILLPPTLNTTDLYTIKFKHQSSINDVLNIITKTIGNLSYTIEDDNIILEYLPKKKGGK